MLRPTAFPITSVGILSSPRKAPAGASHNTDKKKTLAVTRMQRARCTLPRDEVTTCHEQVSRNSNLGIPVLQFRIQKKRAHSVYNRDRQRQISIRTHRVVEADVHRSHAVVGEQAR